jgi:hypothetical protein
VDWIITNPPWSGRAYRPISRHAFEISENVVFLLRLQSGLGTYTRLTDPLEFGHGLKEVVVVDWADAGFPDEGFALAVFHWQRGYRGHPAFAMAENSNNPLTIAPRSKISRAKSAENAPQVPNDTSIETLRSASRKPSRGLGPGLDRE